MDAQPLHERIAGLDDERATQLLATFTRTQLRHSQAPPPAWSADLGGALSSEMGLAPAATPAAGGEVSRHALLVIAADPAHATTIEEIFDKQSPPDFNLAPITGILLITGAMMALQSHIEFERDKSGKWSFKYKKTPTKDSALSKLIAKLVLLISGGPPAP